MKFSDEHEILVEYSEMTSFDFNSEEFQSVRKDYIECRNFISNIIWYFSQMCEKFKPMQNSY